MTQTLVERMHAELRAQTEKPAPDGLIANERTSARRTDNRRAEIDCGTPLSIAEANLKTNQLVLCKSIPAAFESGDAATDPVIDVILGAEPVLEFKVVRVRKN